MLMLTYPTFLAYTLAVALVYLGLGVALARWWHSPGPEPWNRRSREFDQDRYGSAMDGSLSRIRWLPVSNHHEEE